MAQAHCLSKGLAYCFLASTELHFVSHQNHRSSRLPILMQNEELHRIYLTHVEEAIAQELRMPMHILSDGGRVDSNEPIAVDWESFSLSWRIPSGSPEPSKFNVSDLAKLAAQCEERLSSCKKTDNTSLFRDNPSLGNLWKLADEPAESPARISVATLLALNKLESAIRSHVSTPATGISKGQTNSGRGSSSQQDIAGAGALLLKHMLDKISDSPLRAVLKVMLLPKQQQSSTSGLNLRNLWWHGFLGDFPDRSWLSLVLVLCRVVRGTHVETTSQAVSEIYLSILGSTNFDGSSDLCRAIELGRAVAASPVQLECIERWLPASHRGLWHLSRKWMYPRSETTKDFQFGAILCTVWTMLLEHSLRLEWSEANQQVASARAQKDMYYVTLDGFGQRHQHDVLLSPYRLCNYQGDEGLPGDIPNALVGVIGGDCLALLTDLYTSSSGGPNIRAALAHGSLDELLDIEIDAILQGAADNVPRIEAVMNSSGIRGLSNVAYMILAAMSETSARCSSAALHSKAAKGMILSYRPVFSFRAQACSHIASTKALLLKLEEVHGDGTRAPPSLEPPLELEVLRVSVDILTKRYSSMRSQLDVGSGTNQTWTMSEVCDDHAINARLAPLGATFCLLEDIHGMLQKFVVQYTKAQNELQQSDQLSSRQRRKLLRVLSCWRIAQRLYTFAFWVSLSSLSEGIHQSPSALMVKAVQRTRMIVSTFDNQYMANVERTFRPLAEYTRGKAIRHLLLESDG